MAKYRKKPLIVEAEQFHIMEWPNCPEGVEKRCATETLSNGEETGRSAEWFIIKTLEGELNVSDGDWIITGIKGEKYPCKPNIFAETYELVNDEKPEDDATNAIEARDKQITDQQTEIERLKIENAELLNLASGWRNEAIDKKQQIANQQTLIEQLSEACKKGSEELRIWLCEDDCDCPSEGHVCGRPRVLKSKEQLDVAVAVAQNRKT